ncbi:MAG: hypothetical protein AAF721_21565 [Myxococcota bacterium]
MRGRRAGLGVAVAALAISCTFGGGALPFLDEGGDPPAADGAGTGPPPGPGSSEGDGIPNPTATSGGSSTGGSSGESTGGTSGGRCDAPAPLGCACDSDDDCEATARCVANECVSRCGDGVVDRREVCDDGNQLDDDGCDANCQPSSGIAQVAAGEQHTCARTHDGAVKCWGNGANGRLGYGNPDSIGLEQTPADVGFVDVGGPVYDLCAGTLFTCAAYGEGRVRCWGDSQLGKLGNQRDEDIGDTEVPSDTDSIEIGGFVLGVACGDEHACALLEENGTVRCWGRRDNGRLGTLVTEAIGDDEHPNTIDPVQIGAPAVQIVAGDEHTCALLDTGGVRCWGRANRGRLGNNSANPDIGDTEHPDIPANVIAIDSVVAIAGGSDHTCALFDTGAVKCWGDNAAGQLGAGDVMALGDDEPLDEAQFINLGGTGVAIAAGREHTCVVLQTGEVKCWGEGQYGRLGEAGEVDTSTPPVATIDLGNVDARDLSAGGLHTCVRLQGGVLSCFGRNDHGQLGYGPGAAFVDAVGDDESPGSVGFVPVL